LSWRWSARWTPTRCTPWLAEARAPGRRVWALEGTGCYGAGLTRFLVDDLKDQELANRPTTTLAGVADATEQGIQRVCKHEDLVIGFLAHAGLTLDP
jgi:hypothetical protein